MKVLLNSFQSFEITDLRVRICVYINTDLEFVQHQGLTLKLEVLILAPYLLDAFLSWQVYLQ